MNGRVLEGKSREELFDLARAYKWWHSIDLGEMVTSGVTGRWPLTERAFDQVDFTGKKVLDIGCWDGIWSFEAEKRGASEVYSVDLVSQRAWSEQKTYQLAHKLLGSKARYYPNLSVYDIGRLGVTDFDVVIYCGIYYHLQEPLRAFAALREVMSEGGLMIVEGPAVDGTDRVFADFSARTWFAEDPTNWWIPSMPCLREWLDCSFLDVTAEFSGNRNFAPPPASHTPRSPAPPLAPAPPAPPASVLRRLRRRFTAAARALVTPPPSPAVAETQDRISLIARATSPAERLAKRVRRQGLPALSSVPDVTPEAVAGFAEAATRYHQAQPWQRIRPDRTIKLDCASYSKEPAFLMVLGHRTADSGLVVFFQRPGLSLTLQGALLGDLITWPAFLAAIFDGRASQPPRDAEAVFNAGHDYTQTPPNTLRRPRSGELLLLEGCLRAVPGFIERHGGAVSGTEDVSVAVTSGTLQMTLSWVVEGDREL